MTEWRPIPGHEGRYSVSSAGQVRSEPGTRLGGKLLAPHVSKRGYPTVSLYRLGCGPKRMNVHALVAAAFIGERPPGHQVRHLDGNRLNANVANLAYGTNSENVQDAIRHGTNPPTSRERCPRGHLLVGANLYRWHLDVRGHRCCLACARTHAQQSYARKNGREIDFKAEADRRYALLGVESDVA